VTVRNATGATLAKGTIVYISGANGNHVQVTPAIATSDATSARTLGWLSAAIANNADGLCMVEGYLEGINTQSLNAGDQLYLSGTVAGGFTATKPQAPIHLVYVGVVTKKSAGDGHVFVKVQNGYELGELHDVLITSPTNNQVLAYDSATQLWKNAVNAPDGVTSITAVSPLTGGTITSTGSIGLDQTALSITKSQVSDFTSGTVTSASTAQQAGTALFATNASTAVFATTAGTSTTISGTITKSQVSDFTSGTVAQADNATTSGTAVYATNSGTATYSTTSGTALTISGDITRSQVSDFASGTVAQATNASTAVFSSTSGTATFATNASTAVSVSGSAITQSQVVNLTTDLANTAKLNTANTFTVGGHNITAQSAGVLPLLLKGASGQTQHLLQFQNNSGVELTRINNQGSLVMFNSGVLSVAMSAAAGFLALYAQTAATVPLFTRGAVSHTANMQEWQDSNGIVLSAVNSVGRAAFPRISAGNTVDLGYGTLSVSANSASTIGAVIRGAASQSANLLELQTSAGSILSRFDSNANLFNTNRVFVGTNTFQFNTLFVQAVGGTTETTAVIKANTGLTGNLQEWQNSAGTILARVLSDGAMFAPSFTNNNGRAVLGENNAGGTIRLERATAAQTNPGANYARLYFRDGTNAGTLKLVVRAGAAGAETTILDNIPQ
jgi:hypothetical protein